MRGYTQLTQEERYQIYILKKAGHNRTQISGMLGRNQGLKRYRSQQAHNLALARRHSKACLHLTDKIWQDVEVLLRQEWSPEQIVSRFQMEQRVSWLLTD